MTGHSGVTKAMWIGSGVVALGIVVFLVSIGLLLRQDARPRPAIRRQPTAPLPTDKAATLLSQQNARFRPRSIEDVLQLAERSKPAHVDDISAAFDPLPPRLDDVHALAEAFLARYVVLYPQHAPELGEHVHPTDTAAPTFERMVAEALLADHVLRRLDSGAVAIESAHDRTDAAWLRTICESMRKPIVREWTLRWALDAPVPVVFLTHYECCDAETRARDAATLLDAIADQADALPIPPLTERHSLVSRVRERIDEHVAFVMGVPSAFVDAADETRDRLDASARRCAAALEGIADRLPEQFAPAHRQRRGIGEHAYTTALHSMGVRETPLQLFTAARDALYDAYNEMNAAYEQGYDTDVPVDQLATDAATHLEALEPAARALIATEPADPGVRLAPIPSGWPDGQAFLLAPLPGVDAPSIVFVGDLGGAPDPDPQESAFDGRMLRHLLGHEAYPGHHTHHVHQRSACVLRRFFSSPVSAEGWAEHASALLHEAGAVPDDAIDDWVLAQDRANAAFSVMVDVAVNCLGLSAGEIEAWELDFDVVADPLAIAAWAEDYPGHLVAYFVGPRDVAELERRAQESGRDLRDFRARFLGAGGVPPRLLHDELLR